MAKIIGALVNFACQILLPSMVGGSGGGRLVPAIQCWQLPATLADGYSIAPNFICDLYKIQLSMKLKVSKRHNIVWLYLGFIDHPV